MDHISPLLTLVFYTISAFGLAYIMGHAEITLGFRTAWAYTTARDDIFSCNVCKSEYALDDLSQFNWTRSEVAEPKTGNVACPNGGEAHRSGFKLIQRAPAPFLLRLIECPSCFGFWTGLVTATMISIVSWPWVSTIVFLPLFTAGSNFLLGRMTGLIPNPSKE